MCKKEAVDTIALLERIAELSPRQQEQVANFIAFLHQQYMKKSESLEEISDAVGQVMSLGKDPRKDFSQSVQTLNNKC